MPRTSPAPSGSRPTARRPSLLEPILALLMALPLAGALHDCQQSSVRGCSDGPAGQYEIVFDFESLTASFECDGSQAVVAEITETVSGLEVTYLGLGPFAVTPNGTAFEWTESSMREGVTTGADYSISVSDCVVRGHGTFSRQFPSGACEGVVAISGSKTTP
ncbi:MAG: hypothetical protein DHS20C21_09730 [Gemmatimonadota bacterium]|nr:MAG: hypothetical protein DHS20C21_09730 [Gemmatimonadota bacterium]